MSALNINWRLLRVWSWFVALPSIPFIVNPCFSRWPDEPCPTRIEQLLASLPFFLAATATIPPRDLYRDKAMRRWSGSVLTAGALAAILSNNLLRELPATFVAAPDFFFSNLILVFFFLPVFLVPFAVIRTEDGPRT